MSRTQEPRGWDLNLSDSKGTNLQLRQGSSPLPAPFLCPGCDVCTLQLSPWKSLLRKLHLFWSAVAPSCTCSQPFLLPWAQGAAWIECMTCRGLEMRAWCECVCAEQPAELQCEPKATFSEGLCSLPEHLSNIRAGGGQLGGRVAHTSWGLAPAETELQWHGSSRRARTGDEVKVQLFTSHWCWSDIPSRKMAKGKILSSRMTSVNHLTKKLEPSSVMKRNCIFLTTSRKWIRWQPGQVSSQGVSAEGSLPWMPRTRGSSCSHCINTMNTGVVCIRPTSLSWPPHSLLNLAGNTPETFVTNRHRKSQYTLQKMLTEGVVFQFWNVFKQDTESTCSIQMLAAAWWL